VSSGVENTQQNSGASVVEVFFHKPFDTESTVSVMSRRQLNATFAFRFSTEFPPLQYSFESCIILKRVEGMLTMRKELYDNMYAVLRRRVKMLLQRLMVI